MYSSIPNLTNSDLEYCLEDLKSESNFHPVYKLSPLHDVENFAGEHNTPPIVDPFATAPTQEASSPLSPTCTIPCRDDFSGPLDFEIFLDSATAHRKSWVPAARTDDRSIQRNSPVMFVVVEKFAMDDNDIIQYSVLLRKVFIDMNKSLLVQFKVKEYTSGLRVRALPVYSMDDFVSTPVQRCALHELGDDSLRQAHRGDPPVCFCGNYRWVRHVVQSTHPQAQYEYDTESDRHSVLVPLDAPQAGSDIATVSYHFTCKTSCTRGMNRKPIDVIFTLETELCQVLGRQILPVKICSCPKRDKEKEEADSSANRLGNQVKRRMSASEKQEIAKKIKTENNPPRNVEQVNDKPVDRNQEQLGEQLKELESQISFQATKLSELQTEVYQLRIEHMQQKNELVSQIKIQKNELVSQIKVLDAKLDCIFQLLNQQPCNVKL